MPISHCAVHIAKAVGQIWLQLLCFAVDSNCLICFIVYLALTGVWTTGVWRSTPSPPARAGPTSCSPVKASNPALELKDPTRVSGSLGSMPQSYKTSKLCNYDELLGTNIDNWHSQVFDNWMSWRLRQLTAWHAVRANMKKWLADWCWTVDSDNDQQRWKRQKLTMIPRKIIVRLNPWKYNMGFRFSQELVLRMVVALSNYHNAIMVLIVLLGCEGHNEPC